VEFRLLGGLQVLDASGCPVDLRGAQPRALLAALLLAEGRVVSADALVDVLWGESAPPSAIATLHSCVSRLRRVLEPARAAGSSAQVLLSQAPGYRLAVPPDTVDAVRFRALADTGRQLLQQGDAGGAREHLRAADALWRGEALEEFADQPWARTAAVGLTERRVGALEDRVEAELRLGMAAQVAAELPGRLPEHPVRERLHGQLALALYRCGRQADSLAVVEALRRRLRDELGLDLSRPLRDLEQAVLRQDPVARAAAVARGRACPARPGRRRRPRRGSAASR
jgi:DNA-binding SARP family transcriptional activator